MMPGIDKMVVPRSPGRQACADSRTHTIVVIGRPAGSHKHVARSSLFYNTTTSVLPFSLIQSAVCSAARLPAETRAE